MVNIEAFVFDKKGNRVTGLTRADLEILEDGRPVEITNFFAIDRTRTVEGGAGPGGPPTEEDSITVTRPPTRQADYLVVYIDYFNLRPSSRNRALDNLERFLRGFMGTGDNVMLVGASLGAEVVQPATSDWAPVERSLDKMRKATTHR